MDNARVFIHAHDSDMQKHLLDLPAVKRSIVLSGSEHGLWFEECRELEANIVLLYVDSETKDDLSTLTDMDDTAFLFFSSGKPIRELDKLMAKGAGYHFRAPFDWESVNDALDDLLEDLIEKYQLNKKAKTQALTSDLDQFGQLVGSHKSMHKLYRAIRRVAGTDANVLVIGESGTGKELVAHTIHSMSPRNDEAFVAINCGALSAELIDSELFGHKKGAFTGATSDHRGVFEQARGGTLFLDEVTEMPLEHQVRLLRVLEQGEFKPLGSEDVYSADVRIIAASNRDPFEAMDQGFLREDLYFRLAQFPLTVPALRDRGDDVAGLAKHFLAYLNQKEKHRMKISQDALDLITAHDWPGNVRELRHCIERAFILAEDTITAEHIMILSSDDSNSDNDSHNVPVGVPLEDIEQAAIEQTLQENDGNKSETAEQLGISVKTLYNKLDKYQKDDEH